MGTRSLPAGVALPGPTIGTIAATKRRTPQPVSRKLRRFGGWPRAGLKPACINALGERGSPADAWRFAAILGLAIVDHSRVGWSRHAGIVAWEQPQPMEPQVEMLNLETGYAALRTAVGWYTPFDRALVELRGDDRHAWLQGQQTQDLRGLSVGQTTDLCIVSPTGQLLADVRLWCLPDRFLLDVPKAGVEAVLRRCEAMVIMEDVSATDLSGRVSMMTVQGPEAATLLSRLIEMPPGDAGPATLGACEVLCLRSDRSGCGGWDLVADPRALEAVKAACPQVPEEAVEIARIEAGSPVFGQDMNARTLPPELGPAFEARTISYTKGCYTGQEVLMRIHTQGHTNRTWMALVCEGPVPVGASVVSPKRADAGKVTSAALSPRFGPIAAAMLRRKAAVAGDVVEVETPGGPVRAVVRAMPLSP